MVTKEFRHDLFFRLRYFLLTVPPLRERGEDWLLLLDYVLDRLHAQYGVEKRFSKDSLDLLSRCDWPGNVRQLMSVATMGYALAEGDLIEPESFQDQLESRGRSEDDADEDLYHRMIVGREDFWTVVYKPFLARDLNRKQVRAVVRRGLFEAKNSYRDLLELMRIPDAEYQKFMDFLRHHQLKP
jgi:DNA-binding NtrC family response regulator